MRGRPLVTVAIPTHNRARLLAESLESVLAQTFERIEVIVSDNASTDETRRVVDSFADSRVTYTRLDQNVGHLRNLSRCLGLGTAPYVAILQDDDLMLPHNIERKYEAVAADGSIAFVHSAFRFIDDEGRLLNPKASWWDSDSALETPAAFVRGTFETGLRVDLSSPLFRRSLIGAEHFREEEGLAADHGFFLRLGRRGSVAYLDEALTASRRHGGSLSVQNEAHIVDGGFYAPSFTYADGCRLVEQRFVDEFEPELSDTACLRSTSRRRARRDLAGIVRANTRDDPGIRRTAAYVWRAAKIDPTVLLTRKLLMVIAWTLIGGRGRRLSRFLLTRAGATKPER